MMGYQSKEKKIVSHESMVGGDECPIPHFPLVGWFSYLISYLNYAEVLGSIARRTDLGSSRFIF